MGKIQELSERFIYKPLADYLVNQADNNDLNKAGAIAGTKRYQVDLDGGNSNRIKPRNSVPFTTMRRFSVAYDVARACINLRKRQISYLKWNIVNLDDQDETDNTKRANEVRAILSSIGGYNVSMRTLTDMMIEDLMVLDAVALEKVTTYGGDLVNVNPVDAATIQVRVDKSGRTPQPPEIAYKQIIRGKVTAEFTAEQLYYGMLNPRTNSAYGLAPLETLVLTVNSALSSALQNLNYLTDGNIPEGFFGVPENWTATQIKQFQEMFDASVAGNQKATSRIKFMPDGKYTPTKKIDDMRYREFSEWLMKITCSVFDVLPIEIGFEPNQGLGGKGFSEGQDLISNRKGIIPMANFLSDFFDSIIQKDLGYTDLRFKYEGLEYTDAKTEAETNEIKIRSGQSTVDEVRIAAGDKPLGLDKPFVTGQITYIDEESKNVRDQAAQALINMGSDNNTQPDQPAEPTDTTKAADPTDAHIKLVTELRAFRKYAINTMQKGRKLRAFQSDVLPEAAVIEINKRIQQAKDIETVKGIFREFMQDHQVDFYANLIALQNGIDKVL